MARSWATMSPEVKRWGARNVRALRKLGDYDVDDWLGTVGLRRNASGIARTATAAGLVLGGIAVGVAVGMILAPKSGREIRRTIRDRGWKAGAQELRSGSAVEAQSISSTHLS